MKIRLFVFTLLCTFFVFGNLGCASDASSESSSSTSAKSSKSIPSSLKTGWYGVVDKETEGAVERQLDKAKGMYYLDPQPLLTSEHIKDAYFYTGFNKKGVQMELTEKGVDRWADATLKYTRKNMGFVVNDVLITIQRVAAQDLTGATIFYKEEYSEDEMQAIINKLTAGKKQGK